MGITFFRGHPSNDLLPRKEILAAATTVLSTPRPTDDDEETRHPLTYGSDPGALEVRQTLANWINATTSNHEAPTNADCLNLTNGASFGAATALLQCCPSKYTKTAFAITPTYFLINQLFIDAGFEGRMKGIVESDKGIDLEGFENHLVEQEKKYQSGNNEWAPNGNHRDAIDPLKFRYVLYLVPVFSNPGGYTITAEENHKLLQIARKYNVLLLCDHVYDYLDYGSNYSRMETLVSLDRLTLPTGSLGNVIANCSFSKYLGPGLRVGWQECATPQLAYHLSQSGSNKSGGTPAHLNTFIAGDLVQTRKIDGVLKTLNSVYGKRAKSYLEAMQKYLPQGTKIIGGQGGYFFWLTFPPEYNVQAITAECGLQGIRLAPGQHFEVLGDEKGWGDHCFRVSVSYHDAEEAVEAIKLWGEISERHKKIN